jgi:hypothetical protein
MRASLFVPGVRRAAALGPAFFARSLRVPTPSFLRMRNLWIAFGGSGFAGGSDVGAGPGAGEGAGRGTSISADEGGSLSETGEGPAGGSETGEGPARGSEDGEGPARGSEDGEGPARGSEDGEGPAGVDGESGITGAAPAADSTGCSSSWVLEGPLCRASRAPRPRCTPESTRRREDASHRSELRGPIPGANAAQMMVVVDNRRSRREL